MKPDKWFGQPYYSGRRHTINSNSSYGTNQQVARGPQDEPPEGKIDPWQLRKICPKRLIPRRK